MICIYLNKNKTQAALNKVCVKLDTTHIIRYIHPVSYEDTQYMSLCHHYLQKEAGFRCFVLEVVRFSNQ